MTCGCSKKNVTGAARFAHECGMAQHELSCFSGEATLAPGISRRGCACQGGNGLSAFSARANGVVPPGYRKFSPGYPGEVDAGKSWKFTIEGIVEFRSSRRGIADINFQSDFGPRFLTVGHGGEILRGSQAGIQGLGAGSATNAELAQLAAKIAKVVPQPDMVGVLTPIRIAEWGCQSCLLFASGVVALTTACATLRDPTSCGAAAVAWAEFLANCQGKCRPKSWDEPESGG